MWYAMQDMRDAFLDVLLMNFYIIRKKYIYFRKTHS